MTLTDDFELDPESTEYRLNIIVEPTNKEEKPDPTDEDDEDEKDKDKVEDDQSNGELPTFKLKELSFVGELTITFS